MNIKKRNNKRTWRLIIVIVVIQILLDPLSAIVHSSENYQARIGLPAARNKWEAQNITHYRFDVYMWYQNGPCFWTGNLEVRGGVVVIAGRRSDWPGPYGDSYPELPSFESLSDAVFLCNYYNFTIPRLFDELERRLQTSLPVSQISFDSHYGFISRVQFGNPGQRGMLNGVIADCCHGFSIENFQVLEK